jgi:hypothetical protein
LSLGAAAALGLIVWGAVITVDVIDDWSGTRIGATRTRAPGARDVRLDATKYVVFYEVAERSVPSGGDGSTGDIPIPPRLDVKIRRGGDGPPLPLDDYATDFHVSGGTRAARAVWTVQVPEAGRYRIAAAGAFGADEPAVVLGRPVGRRVVRLVAGIFGIVGGFMLGLVVGVIAVVLAIRRP